MAKLTLTDLGTTLSNTAANTINNNGGLIEAAVEKTLSRDGTSPNQMEVDFDLNGNDLINGGTVNAGVLYLGGALVSPSDLVSGNFATTAQGAKADTALQPANIGVSVQAFDTDLTAIAALSTSADKVPYSTGVGTWGLSDLTPFARLLLADATAPAMGATLGLGSMAYQATTSFQPIDTDLTAIAALTSAADKLPYATGAGTWALTDLTSYSRTLLDDTTAGAALTTLGVSAFAQTILDDADANTARTTLGITTGTYTPTLTNTTNVAASTAYVCQWMRINNVITVSGKVDIDVTAAGNALMGLSLPIASALTLDTQMGGTFTSNAAATPETGCIFADATNDRASFKFIAVNTANNTFFFSFTYLVL